MLKFLWNFKIPLSLESFRPRPLFAMIPKKDARLGFSGHSLCQLPNSLFLSLSWIVLAMPFSVHLSISTQVLQTILSKDPTHLAVAREGGSFAVFRAEGARRWTDLLVQASTYLHITNVAGCAAGLSCHLRLGFGRGVPCPAWFLSLQETGSLRPLGVSQHLLGKTYPSLLREETSASSLTPFHTLPLPGIVDTLV